MPKGFRADSDWLQKHGFQLGDGPAGVVPIGPPLKGKPLVDIFAPHLLPVRARKKMNNVELRWLEVLKKQNPYSVVTPQFRLRVSAYGEEPVHYTADFLVATEHHGWHLVLWEVKDSRRKPHSDELVRAKTVRLQNPWISAVYLAVWNGREWAERAL